MWPRKSGGDASSAGDSRQTRDKGLRFALGGGGRDDDYLA